MRISSLASEVFILDYAISVSSSAFNTFPYSFNDKTVQDEINIH